MVPVIKGAETMDFAGFHATYEQAGREGAHQQAACPTTSPAPRCRSPTRAGSARWRRCRGSWPARGASSRSARSRSRPSSRPWRRERLTELGISKVMTVTSTYDHRIIQGAESGAFLGDGGRAAAGGEGFYDGVFASLGIGATGTAGAAPLARSGSASAEPTPPLARSAAPVVPVASGPWWRRRGSAARRGGDGAGEGVPDPRPSRGAARSARQRADRRSGARSRCRSGSTPEVMARIPSHVLRIATPGATLAEALSARCSATYCGTIAYEVEHIASHEERVWLRRADRVGRVSARRCRPTAKRRAARAADRRWRRSSGSSTRRTSGRSASRSRAWTCWCRCSTR